MLGDPSLQGLGCIFRTGRRRFRVGGDSAWSAGSQRGVLISTLLRANAKCSQNAAVFPLCMRAILRVVAEAHVWGGYSMSALRRVVSYLAAKTEERATAAFWRLLTFILRSVCSALYAYGLFCQSASRSWGLPLSLVW